MEDSFSRVPKPLSFFFSKVNISNTQDASSSELSRQAQEHLSTAVDDAMEPVGEHRDRMDLPLISKNGSSQASHRVAYGPTCVAFETNHLIGTLHHLEVLLAGFFGFSGWGQQVRPVYGTQRTLSSRAYSLNC